MKIPTTVVLSLSLCLFFVTQPLAQNAIPYDVVGCGGGESSGGGYYLNGTIGQPSIGVTSGASNWNKVGYWYVVDELHIGPTSEVTITAFEVEVIEEGVLVRWVVGGSSDPMGFNVYRSLEEEGFFERLNENPISPREFTYLDRDARPGATYWYKVGALDLEGEFFSPVGRAEVPPRATTLYQNYPNPFNPVTTVSFYVPKTEDVSLVIYDAGGKVVRTLFTGRVRFGKHEVMWDGMDDRGEPVGSGVYFYRLRAGKTVMTRKLTLVK